MDKPWFKENAVYLIGRLVTRLLLARNLSHSSLNTNAVIMMRSQKLRTILTMIKSLEWRDQIHYRVLRVCLLEQGFTLITAKKMK